VSNTRDLNTWKKKKKKKKKEVQTPEQYLSCHLFSQSFILAFVSNPEEDIPWI
jgi:hypothetical protein